MKFAAALLASTAAVASAATCDVSILSGLVATTEFTGCQDDSGYTITSLVVPTDAEVAKICTSSSCKQLLADLNGLVTVDCSLGSLNILSDLVDPIVATCGWGSSSGSADSATVGSTSSGSTDATVTTAPVASSSSSSSSAAAPTATTAAPTSSSGSSTGSASTGSSSASSIATGVAATAFAVAAAAML